MKVLASLAGGLAGAITVTILHELFRKVDPAAPRLDLLGEKATQTLAKKAGKQPLTGNQLYTTSLAGSIMANTLTYSLAGISGKKPLSIGSLLGLTMGVGAITLPRKMGAYSRGNPKRKWMTLCLYIAGGLVASAITRRLEKRRKKHLVSPYKSPDEAFKPVLDIMV